MSSHTSFNMWKELVATEEPESDSNEAVMSRACQCDWISPFDSDLIPLLHLFLAWGGLNGLIMSDRSRASPRIPSKTHSSSDELKGQKVRLQKSRGRWRENGTAKGELSNGGTYSVRIMKHEERHGGWGVISFEVQSEWVGGGGICSGLITSHAGATMGQRDFDLNEYIKYMEWIFHDDTPDARISPEFSRRGLTLLAWALATWIFSLRAKIL